MPARLTKAARQALRSTGLRGLTRSARIRGALPLSSDAATTRCPDAGGNRDRQRPRGRSDRGPRADPRADKRRSLARPDLRREPKALPGAAPLPPAHRSGTRIRPDSVPARRGARAGARSEEHTSELQSLRHLVCRLLLEKKKKKKNNILYIKQKNTNIS